MEPVSLLHLYWSCFSLVALTFRLSCNSVLRVPVFVFKVVSDWEKVYDRPDLVCLCVCVCVCPSQAVPQKLLTLPSSSLARWLPQTRECIPCSLYWPWPSFKVTQILIIKMINVRLFQKLFQPAMPIKFAVKIVYIIIFSQSDDLALNSRSQLRLKGDRCLTCTIIAISQTIFKLWHPNLAWR